MTTVSTHVATTLATLVPTTPAPAHQQHSEQRRVHVFGVMGNGNAYLLDALTRDPHAVYTAVRHEAGGVFAADAHYRAGGGVAVATATYGAGFTNTMTALAEAVQARTPLVLVVGDEPTSGPRPWDVDQIGLASSVGARTYTVGATDAAATTAIALEHAVRFRVPVVLALPYDVAAQEAGPVPPVRPLRVEEPLALTGDYMLGALENVAQHLATAERPFLLAGRGAHLADAGQELGRLAAATHAVTASTALGRGIFPDTEHDLGVTGGFGVQAAMELVGTADVVVVFGAMLNQFTMRFGKLFGPETRVVQVDIAANATHPHVGTFLRGDAKLVAAALADRVEELKAAEGATSGWRETVDVAALTDRGTAPEFAEDGLLDPRAAAARIGELLPRDRVVVSDGGHFIGWANMYWPVTAPQNMLMVGTAYQTIGTGFPSVPGAVRARPEATVVLTSGDGGGLMCLPDLESAVRAAGGHGMAVVFNDAAYGAEVHLYGTFGLQREPMLIPQVSFAGLADAVGGRGVVVESLADLEVLADWAGQDPDTRPFLLLDLRVSGTVRAPYQDEVIAVNS